MLAAGAVAAVAVIIAAGYGYTAITASDQVYTVAVPLDRPTHPRQAQPPITAGGVYSLAVARICAGALLFEEAHAIGTRAGALAVARDIRASARRRFARVANVPTPPALQRPVARWLVLERRLAASYADHWVRMYDTIDAARTPKQHAELASRLEKLVHAPDGLRRAAGRLELRLNLPDCTGGDPPAGVDRSQVRGPSA